MNLNVTGVFRMTKLVLPVMLHNPSLGLGRGGECGCIINNASDWGLVGAPNASAYCCSKGMAFTCVGWNLLFLHFVSFCFVLFC
jgi:short-subunit dehydrogenase